MSRDIYEHRHTFFEESGPFPDLKALDLKASESYQNFMATIDTARQECHKSTGISKEIFTEKPLSEIMNEYVPYNEKLASMSRIDIQKRINSGTISDFDVKQWAKHQIYYNTH